MKILFTSHRFLPDVGGIETHSLILANFFIKAGHKVVLVTKSYGQSRVDREKFDFPIFRRPNNLLLWNLYRRDESPTTVRTSSFFGLLQTLRGDDGRRHWRWFWLPNSHFRETSRSSTVSADLQNANPPSPRFQGLDTVRGADLLGSLSRR